MGNRLGCLVLLFATRAFAETDAEAAVRLGTEGDSYWERGRCDLAIKKWQEADGHFHAPTLIYRVARCQAILGQVVAATHAFESIVNEELKPNAPAPFVEAHELAQHWLAGVKDRIANLRVAVEAPPPGVKLKASLDGRELALGIDAPQDPGPHQLTVTAANESSHDEWRLAVPLDDGEKRTVSLGVAIETAPPPPQTLRRTGWGLLGGGALVAAVAGFGFGVPAVVQSSQLSQQCRGYVCSASDASKISALRLNAVVADVGVTVGGLAAATGAFIVLFFPPPKDEGPRVRVVPSPIGASLVGAF